MYPRSNPGINEYPSIFYRKAAAHVCGSLSSPKMDISITFI